MLKRIEQLFVFVFALILALGYCTQSSILEFESTLLCNDQFRVYNLSEFSLNQQLVYSIQIQVLSSSYLPITFSLHNENSTVSLSSEADFEQIDVTSLQLDKKTQKLYVQPKNISYYLKIRRVDLKQVYAFTNIDRNIQNYQGNNKQKLLFPSIDIKFKVRITEAGNSLLDSSVVAPPLYETDCYNSAKFDQKSRACYCTQDFGMKTCQTYFEKIQSVDQVYRKIFKPQSKFYYYFEPKQSFFLQKQKVQFQINLKGALSKNFTYSESVIRPQFYILWHLQSNYEQLKVPSYFDQMDPAQVSNVSMRKGERLILTVYKPTWGSQQVAEIVISTKTFSLSQFVVILIAVSCALTIFSIVVLVVYFVCCRNKRNREEALTMGPSMPIWRKNKTFNNYFDVDRYFPTITFKELKAAAGLSEANLGQEQKPSCAICLQVFQQDTEVKSTFCLHIFHQKCLNEWTLRQPSCPLCRDQFSTQNAQKMEQFLEIYDCNLSVSDRYAKIWKMVKNKQSKPNQQLNFAMEMESSHNIRSSNEERQQ